MTTTTDTARLVFRLLALQERKDTEGFFLELRTADDAALLGALDVLSRALEVLGQRVEGSAWHAPTLATSDLASMFAVHAELVNMYGRRVAAPWVWRETVEQAAGFADVDAELDRLLRDDDDGDGDGD